MTKALIVYGTRYGATASTSEEIANVLRKEGFEVKVVNAKKEKVHEIKEYDLVIVGSGMQIGKWTSEAENFLKKFSKELMQKKLAIFVSSAAQALIEYEGKPEEIGKAKKKYLEEKAAKYSLQPIALGLFGGVWDYNKMPWWVPKKGMEAAKPKIEAAGFKEKAGVYDTRNWDSIRSWAQELAQKVRSLEKIDH